MTSRTVFFIALLAFAVTLAIVVGNRLSTEAMPIVFGVAVGVAVGIPTSVLVAALTRQVAVSQPTGPAHRSRGSGNGTAPAGHPRRASLHVGSEGAAPLATGERQFTVVGGAAPPLLEDDFPDNGDHR